MSKILISVFVAALGVGAFLYLQKPAVQDDSEWPVQTGALANVIVPAQFSDDALIGERAYTASCVACHGENGEGRDGMAPPLVHKIYEPGHHGDEAFQRAAAMGVHNHHWPFGDMPPVDGVTRGDVATIVAYIRELQRANGIN